jgi:hypothetical protein
MRFRYLLAILASLTAVALSGLPAHALTTWADSPYEGSGALYLSACPQPGDQVAFYIILLDFQAVGTYQGHSDYYIHPAGHDNICITASTTQFGVIKSENCVGSQYTQQDWTNYECGLTLYWDNSVYWGATINDKNKLNGQTANLTAASSCAANGYTMQQTPP